MLDDESYMRMCFDLARQAEGRTSPNPLVGSVVVDDDGTVIASGFHKQAGMAHAEVEALNAAGERARGKTLYVSLEPCSHFGRTPPCSERVIASGVKRVVCGMIDPNPKVGGNGLRAIKAAGIDTTSGVLEQEARYLNRAFLKWIEQKIPWTTLKIAATLDGRIADRNRRSRWISGPEARQFVQELRNKTDAVMIGVATAITDDSELIVRDVPNSRNPYRIILDPRLELPPQSRLCANPDGKTIVMSAEKVIESRAREYCENVRFVAAQMNGRQIDLQWVMWWLGTQNILSVLCEGGSRLSGSLLDARLVDEVQWIVAPKLLYDGEAISATDSPSIVTLPEAVELHSHTVRQLGNDVLISGLINTP